MTGQAGLGFAGLLRQLREEAQLTQEELAEAARVSQRAVSDLEQGINRTARKDTAVLLVGALGLDGQARELFIAAARGRVPADDVLAARQGVPRGVFAAAATRGLPRDTAAFTGREAELARLLGAIDTLGADGGVVVGIHAIGGMAGVGKTTFAVHAAHRLAERFPDGQFFLPLHAHTTGQRPVDPVDGLVSLLLAAGLAAAQIPPGLEARAARWRDQVAGRKILLVLDDAGHEQVRPLLPGTAGSLVLVTSRRRLTALEDAAVTSLDVLPAGEAAALLARLASRSDVTAGDAGVGQITALCGHLPLAIGMLASQLRHHPAWSAAQLATALAQARDRLAMMRAENLSVAAAFDLSYADLTGDQQRLFRRLGLVPGPSFDAHAAAALDNTALELARRHLDGLYDQHLLTEPAPGRYQLHDLLREHARALAAADNPADCDAATSRLLDYYLDTALAAGRHLPRWMIDVSSSLPQPRPLESAPPVSTSLQAAAWLEAERPNLHAAAGYAAAHGFLRYAIAIPAAISGFLRGHGYWDQAAALNQAALATARQAGEQVGQASTLQQIGMLGWLTGDYPAAAASLQQALALFRDLGDQLGQASALNQLGIVHELTGDYPAAATSQRQALALFRDLDQRAGQASVLNDLGRLHLLTRDYATAAATQQQSLTLFREVNDRLGQAAALDDLGVVQSLTGDYTAAAASHTQALEQFRELGDRLGQAEALNNLGELLTRSPPGPQAEDHHAQALAIARDIGAPLEEARALEGIGRGQLQEGSPGEATSCLRQALSIYQRLGSPRARHLEETLTSVG